MGKGRTFPWDRASDDVAKAGKVIARTAGEPVRAFVPQRRVDVFDQIQASRRHQSVVMPKTIRPGSLPERVEERKVYLLDGRESDAQAVSHALHTLTKRIDTAGLSVQSFGALS
jgi:hypothetical protein